METKNYTQVLIDGKIYTLGGSEDEAYLQRTASYVNEKNMDAADSGSPGWAPLFSCCKKACPAA